MEAGYTTVWPALAHGGAVIIVQVEKAIKKYHSNAPVDFYKFSNQKVIRRVLRCVEAARFCKLILQDDINLRPWLSRLLVATLNSSALPRLCTFEYCFWWIYYPENIYCVRTFPLFHKTGLFAGSANSRRRHGLLPLTQRTSSERWLAFESTSTSNQRSKVLPVLWHSAYAAQPSFSHWDAHFTFVQIWLLNTLSELAKNKLLFG